MVKPLIYNLFKPPGPSSFDVVREVKKAINGKDKKVGHFGTLDPFACGVLLIGRDGAAKLNDYVHELLPKTYLAVGKLGVQTCSGDLSDKVEQVDEGDYFIKEISQFKKHNLEASFRQKFVGEYWQAPPAISAAKFKGRPLYEWSRSGVEIKKEKKKKHIFDLKILRYNFPYIIFRAKVSSGTYIRSLFIEMAQHLGTIGALSSLVRESVGHIHLQNSLFKRSWKNLAEINGPQVLSPAEVIPLSFFEFTDTHTKKYNNGMSLNFRDVEQNLKLNPYPLKDDLFWAFDQKQNLLGLARRFDDQIKVAFRFSQ